MMVLKEYHVHDYWQFALAVQTRDEDNGCLLRVGWFSRSWWFVIPQIFKPQMKWVDTSSPEAPSKGFWNPIMRTYGFSCDKEALHINYGIQPGRWSRADPKNSDHTKVFFLPWNQQRRLHLDYISPDGALFRRVYNTKNGALNFPAMESAEDSVPKSVFKFNDFDGEEIVATCYIKESVYRWGTGLFKWLGYIFPKKVYRKLDLSFNKEIGYEKGSWKGGTLGHSIEMLSNETPHQSFTRYGASEDHYKYHGKKSRGFTNIEQIS